MLHGVTTRAHHSQPGKAPVGVVGKWKVGNLMDRGEQGTTGAFLWAPRSSRPKRPRLPFLASASCTRHGLATTFERLPNDEGHGKASLALRPAGCFKSHAQPSSPSMRKVVLTFRRFGISPTDVSGFHLLPGSPNYTVREWG